MPHQAYILSVCSFTSICTVDPYTDWDGRRIVSQNPFYMEPSALVSSSRSGTLSPPPGKNVQNPTYAIAQFSANHTASPPPLPPMRTGSHEKLLSPPPKNPQIAFGKEDHPYDTIPAFQGRASPPPMDIKYSSVHYHHLQDSKEGTSMLPHKNHLSVPAAPALASGQYDHLEAGTETNQSHPQTKTAENPYIIDPSMPRILSGAGGQMPRDSSERAGRKKPVKEG